MGLIDRLIRRRTRWQRKQTMAAPSRYYGDGGTIHSSGYLDVETFHGTVVAIWFRCQPLPFQQTEVDGPRATGMERMYGNERQDCGVTLTGVEVLDNG